MEDPVTPRVRALLATRIDSFEKLELVVALSGEPRATSSVERMAERLGVARHLLREAAMGLNADSLVELTSAGELQLLPPTDRDREAIAELVALYNDDRMAVVKALGEVALDRIRGMASRVFADAFVIRKNKDDKDG